jgi:quinol monooxygenase YgiN
MPDLEVIVRMKIRPGQLDGFTSQVDEIVRATRENDTHTLRCDVFVDTDGTECEVHERFPDEQGLLEHKLHTMDPTVVLLREFAFDHQATIFGEVSDAFVELVTQRMGPPSVFAFVRGLDAGHAAAGARDGDHLEVIARLRIRPGRLTAFERHAEELVRLTATRDTRTLRYDWFVDSAGTECEVHEAYLDSDGLVEHNAHVMDARAEMFRDVAFDHRMSAYGELSPHLRALGRKHAGGIREFRFLRGLRRAPAV